MLNLKQFPRVYCHRQTLHAGSVNTGIPGLPRSIPASNSSQLDLPCRYPHGFDCRTSFDRLGYRASGCRARVAARRRSLSCDDRRDRIGGLCGRHCTGLAGTRLVVQQQRQAPVDHTSQLDPLGPGLDRPAGLLLCQPGQACTGRAWLRLCRRWRHASAGRLAQSIGGAVAADEALLVTLVEERSVRCARHRGCLDRGPGYLGSGLVAGKILPAGTGAWMATGSGAAHAMGWSLEKLRGAVSVTAMLCACDMPHAACGRRPLHGWIQQRLFDSRQAAVNGWKPPFACASTPGRGPWPAGWRVLPSPSIRQSWSDAR